MINEQKLRNLEKLHELKAAGILSEEEFTSAKEDLLQGKNRAKPAGSATPLSLPVSPDMEENLQWALLPLRRYAQFDGRSSRQEFWMFQLMIIGAVLALFLIVSIIPSLTIVASLIGAIVLIGTIIPSIAVQVRRFHDQDKSGLFALLNLIPFAGIIILIFMALPGTDGENKYGLDPRAE